jgi:hypothetical protein
MESLKDYLEKRNINISPNQKERILQTNYNEYNILEQIDLICDFHNRVKDGEGIYLLRLQSNIGKEMEEYKVNIKRLRKMLLDIEREGIKDAFENELLSSGHQILFKAEACVKYIEESEYIELIKRSMRSNELSIGSCENTNLWKNENYICIFDTSKLCFNMVEWDCITYLSKIKRRGIHIDYGKVIESFVLKSGLDKISENYIKAMVSYPYEYMKVCARKREGKKKWSAEEYGEKLSAAKLKDGGFLV